MSIVFIAAESRELAGIARRCRNLRRTDQAIEFARSGELNGGRVLLLANGPGAKLALEAYDSVRERPEAVVSTGFCGGLDPGLKRGGIFVATSVCGRECRAPATARPFFSGSLATVDRVVGTAEEKARLRATGAAAVDMESAALAERAAAAGVPFYIVRVVLDGAGESFHTDFNRMRDAAGRFSRASIARAALARPLRMLPEVIRLERRGRAAARALGDFLADCRF